MSIQAVKGTRDFYPEKLAFRNWFSEHIRNTCHLFGYEEWDGPLLEPFELYAAKSGDELVNEQAFVLEDRGGRKIVLRPELTPSLARMIAQKQFDVSKPIRWFSIGPMWRYEQPQRGRAREFWQFNCDILGTDSIYADAEVIQVAIRFLISLGLTEKDFVIKINDRAWFKDLCKEIGIDEKEVGKILEVVDKLDKMDEPKWKEYARSRSITSDQVDTLYDRIMKTSYADPDTSPLSPAVRSTYEILRTAGFEQYVEADLSVVRGLNYYTGIVFEIRDRKGALRAIGGGGRYSNLVEQVGGQPIEAVGFAIGDMPLEELLREVNKYPNNVADQPQVLVTVFSKDTFTESLQIAEELRKNAIATCLYIPQTEKDYDLHKQLKFADQKSIPTVLLLGPNEIKDKKVTLKKLETGDQQTIDQKDLLSNL